MIQHGVKACVSLAWMNTCGATPPTATNTSPSSWTSLPYETVAVPPGSWTWSRAAPSRFSKPGWPPSPDTWRERIEIVAMDGFTGFKSAAAEELPGARAVMDPFHVVHLAGNALDECRRRIQQELHHRRGRATDPLYKARRMLHTRSCLLTPRQQHQILDLFASDYHVALEVTWSVYQNIIDAYRAPDTDVGKALMQAEINTLTSTRVPRGLTELITLGRTLKRRAGDILAYFDHPHTSNGPTEAINGRLEHLRGSALGLAKPHQLHHPSTPRNRRIQTPTTPPIMKSRKSGHCTDDDCGAPGELRAELWG